MFLRSHFVADIFVEACRMLRELSGVIAPTATWSWLRLSSIHAIQRIGGVSWSRRRWVICSSFTRHVPGSSGQELQKEGRSRASQFLGAKIFSSVAVAP